MNCSLLASTVNSYNKSLYNITDYGEADILQ